jgi:hypothetical protein
LVGVEGNINNCEKEDDQEDIVEFSIEEVIEENIT